jgi:hypothetical protein
VRAVSVVGAHDLDTELDVAGDHGPARPGPPGLVALDHQELGLVAKVTAANAPRAPALSHGVRDRKATSGA